MKNQVTNGLRGLRALSVLRVLRVGALTLLPLFAATAWSQEVLKFNHTDAPGGSRDRAAQLFAKKVNEYTNGRYRVLVFHSGQLGNDAGALDQVIKGEIDFVVSATGVYAGKSKALNLTGLPYLVDTYQQGWKFYDESKWVKGQFDQLPAKGFRVLHTWEAGFRSFTTKSPLHSPKEAAGKTIRIYKNEMLQWIMESIGFQTKVMGVGEVYAAIQKGEVEGQENPVDTINSLRFYEVAPNVTLTRHVYSPLPLTMSEKTWLKLSPADQAAVKRAAQEAGRASRLEVRDNEERQLADMQAKGAKIDRTPDIAAFRKAVEPVYQKARADYGKDVDDILADAALVRKEENSK